MFCLTLKIIPHVPILMHAWYYGTYAPKTKKSVQFTLRGFTFSLHGDITWVPKLAFRLTESYSISCFDRYSTRIDVFFFWGGGGVVVGWRLGRKVKLKVLKTKPMNWILRKEVGDLMRKISKLIDPIGAKIRIRSRSLKQQNLCLCDVFDMHSDST